MNLHVGRLIRWTPVIIVVAFIAAQMVPVERGNPASDPSHALKAHLQLPGAVAAALDRGCRDCHSNDTRWPWYSRVAPASWLLAGHVSEGREHLNFSEWTGYDRKQLEDNLKGMCEEPREGKMPMPSYLLLHPAARLRAHEIDAICAWTESVRARLTTTPSERPAADGR